MMLGGLGAISLFVAALGITNTMIMSISGADQEIGVMKSLGCFVRDIRRIFPPGSGLHRAVRRSGRDCIQLCHILCHEYDLRRNVVPIHGMEPWKD